MPIFGVMIINGILYGYVILANARIQKIGTNGLLRLLDSSLRWNDN